MSLVLCGKPLLLWNTQTPLSNTPVTPGTSNHICMFGGKNYGRDLAQHIHKLHSENGLYCRLKQYSTMYHDYLLDSRKKKDELIPAGCVEFFCNGLHVVKDSHTLPILHTILQHVMPLQLDKWFSSPEDAAKSQEAGTESSKPQQNEKAAKHNDFLVHCGVTDFDAAFSTAATEPNPFFPRGSQTLHVSLQSLDFLFYTNVSCPCCRNNASELLLNFSVDSFSFAQSGCFSQD